MDLHVAKFAGTKKNVSGLTRPEFCRYLASGLVLAAIPNPVEMPTFQLKRLKTRKLCVTVDDIEATLKLVGQYLLAFRDGNLSYSECDSLTNDVAEVLTYCLPIIITLDVQVPFDDLLTGAFGCRVMSSRYIVLCKHDAVL